MSTRSIISKTIGGVALGALVVGGSIFGINAVHSANADTGTSGFSAAVVPANQTSTANQLAALSAQGMVDAQKQSDADYAAAQAAALAAQQAAAAQAAQVAAAKAAATKTTIKANATVDNPTGLPAGSVVPSIPGTTSPDTTKCASSSASDNASGVAICD